MSQRPQVANSTPPRAPNDVCGTGAIVSAPAPPVAAFRVAPRVKRQVPFDDRDSASVPRSRRHRRLSHVPCWRNSAPMGTLLVHARADRRRSAERFERSISRLTTCARAAGVTQSWSLSSFCVAPRGRRGRRGDEEEPRNAGRVIGTDTFNPRRIKYSMNIQQVGAIFDSSALRG